MPVLHRLFLLLCIASVLTACTSARADRAAQQALAPTASPTIIDATATSTPTTTPTATSSPTPVPPTPTPTPTLEPITGDLALTRGLAPQRLIAVMLDNSAPAYPQTGMDAAVLVFEALTEYGITRYMAVFAPGISPEAPKIGAVRSARLYFVQWAMGLNAVFVHAGGSPDGLALAESATEIANMDALRNESSAYFYRSEERDAPFNLYTTSADLQQFVEDRDVGNFDPAAHGFLFKHDRPVAERPESQRLSYYFIFADDPAGWVYHPESNGYHRMRRDTPHIDERTGAQTWTKNVVVMEVAERPIPGDDKGRIEQQILGEGPARLFVDGIEQEIRWSKPAAAAPLRFYDQNGDEVRFNAGPIWIAAIPSLDNLTVE